MNDSKKILTAIVFGLAATFGVALPASAQIVVETDPDSRVFSITGNGNNALDGFSFEDYAEANGFTTVISDGEISFLEDGTLVFELIGSVTGGQNLNLFQINNQTVASAGGVTNFIGNDGTSGQAISTTLAVSAGQFLAPLRFRRTTYGRTRRTQGIEQFGFGLVVPASLTASGLETLLFAFEDGTGTRDFDDLLIRASFIPTSVPEPGSLLMLLIGLLGVGLINRRAG